MIDQIFDLCVLLLDTVAALLGTSYVAVNVWFFCVIWPAFTIWLIFSNIQKSRELNSVKHHR